MHVLIAPIDGDLLARLHRNRIEFGFVQGRGELDVLRSGASVTGDVGALAGSTPRTTAGRRCFLLDAA